MSKIIGIYKITNVVNKKVYIGSSIDINVRWQQHFNELNSNKHINKRLQNAWNRYGQSNFLFEILQVLESEDKLLLIEQNYLDKYKPYNRNIGYNIAKFASAPMRGRKHTKVAIQKQIANQSGPKNWQFGKKRTKKHAKALGLALGGLTEEKENHLVLDYKSSVYTINDLIHKYNISKTQIYRILNRNSEKSRKNTHLSEAIKQSILEDFLIGLSRAQIRKKYNVKKTTLHYLIKSLK